VARYAALLRGLPWSGSAHAKDIWTTPEWEKREKLASCDWLIPDRLSDGYGLSAGSVEQLRRRGTRLVITVDCGIGSVDEVAAAQAAGILVVVPPAGDKLHVYKLDAGMGEPKKGGG
jgi:hypothetical protein